jgi:3',5'-cyclic AMP phosphodiesterase CpdA
VFRLAHLSDPHLGPLPPVRLSDLASKRVLGFLNWHLHRARTLMQAGSVEDVIADIKRAEPDHIAVTGDLINIGLMPEIENARDWLAEVGQPDAVSLVPGNHDAYVPGSIERAVAAWAPYVSGDDGSPGFPYVRRRGDVAIIGISSAIATGPFMATGRVDDEQLRRLERILFETGAAGLFRVVLVHHLPVDGATKWKSRLLHAGRLRAVIAKAGAELILHGHTHRVSVNWINGKTQPVPVVGVQAASLQPSREKRGAGWNLFEIEGHPGTWRIGHIAYGIERGNTAIGELSRTILSPP